jgi:hypothetical protein
MRPIDLYMSANRAPRGVSARFVGLGIPEA